MLELKRLSADAVPSARKRALHYRLLNQPVLAESICRDILAIDPDDQEALVTLCLSICDQFGVGQGATAITPSGFAQVVSWAELPARLAGLLKAADPKSEPPVFKLINRQRALEAADNDTELLASLVELYFEQLPGLVCELELGVAERRAEKVE